MVIEKSLKDRDTLEARDVFNQARRTCLQSEGVRDPAEVTSQQNLC